MPYKKENFLGLRDWLSCVKTITCQDSWEVVRRQLPPSVSKTLEELGCQTFFLKAAKQAKSESALQNAIHVTPVCQKVSTNEKRQTHTHTHTQRFACRKVLAHVKNTRQNQFLDALKALKCFPKPC